jgi:hypothetical protein
MSIGIQIIMMIENFKFTYWACFRLIEPLLYTLSHKEVLKITWKYNDIFIHLDLLLA